MLDLEEIRKLPGYKLLTPAGIDYVELALASPPSRPVGENSLLSVSGSHSYTRFDRVIEYESESCENAFVLLCEIDRTVLELVSQPGELQSTRPNARGRGRPHSYTPDLLQLKSPRFWIRECKPLSQLMNPKKFPGLVRDEKGAWRYTPYEDAVRVLGMEFAFFVPEDLPKPYLTNLQIFSRITSDDLLVGKAKTIERITEALLEQPRTIGELCGLFADVTGALIYQAIKRGILAGLISRQQFDSDFLVFAEAEQMKKHEDRLNSLAVPNAGALGPYHSRLLKAATNALEDAKEAERVFDERREKHLKWNATDYRYRRKQEECRIEGAPRIAAFVPNYTGRGHPKKGSRLAEATLQAMQTHWNTYLREAHSPLLSKQYANFAAQMEVSKQYCPSACTYRRRFLSAVAPEKAAFLMGGKRAFHQARPMIDGAVANPRLSIAALHVHIDGVYGDARSEPDEEQQYLRPIFYPMVDDATGFVLGRGVKVGRPSSIAPLMALRDCILRNKALPAKIFHDWGPELWNLILTPTLDYFRVNAARRPAGASRFGGLGESFNRQLSAYLQTLAGGMYFDKAGRSADGSKKSARTAELSLAEIIRLVDFWIFEIWNKTPIGSNTLSPSELFKESLRIFPEAMVSVVDDELSRYHTSFPLEVKKFDYVRGFRYGGTRFNSDDIGTLIRGQELPTGPRLDTTDPSIIRAMSSTGVVSLRSLQFQRIQGLGDGARLEQLEELLCYASRAAENQFQRNLSEARKHLEQQKVAEALQEASGETSNQESAGVDSVPLVFPSLQQARQAAELFRLGN